MILVDLDNHVMSANNIWFKIQFSLYEFLFTVNTLNGFQTLMCRKLFYFIFSHKVEVMYDSLQA